jgi:amino acid transporter
MTGTSDRSSKYEEGSLSLAGAVSLGTGVMIGAGIFALTGQIAELAGSLFPAAFLAAAVVSGFSAYSYVKMSRAWPSAGGIAMFLEKAYGETAMTGAMALLMYFSMVINESLVARTFGTYTMQLFNGQKSGWLVPGLGVALIALAFLVNILSNRFIETFSFFMAFIKVAGLLILAGGGLWASGLSFRAVSLSPEPSSGWGFLGAVALGVLAFKGFTTITNSGSELKDPHKNVGRAIIISISVCVMLYLLVALAVGGNLTIEQIVQAKDYSLAEAARPAYGRYGLWITVVFAIVATVSGIIASMFAVSRMLAMLTEMKLVPHSHFGMPGSIQKHTLVYTAVLAMSLTVFYDLGRIAALGAIFYIIMDIAVHWGVLGRLLKEVKASASVLVAAIVMDAAVLGALLWVKARSDPLVIYSAITGIVLIFAGERLFLRYGRKTGT